MKRVFAWTLILLLIGGMSMAEGSGFAFRDGVTWGITQAEVLAIENPVEYDVEPYGAAGAQVLEIDDLVLEGSEYELEYLFIGDALLAAKYEFDAEDIAPATIGDSLDEKFGAHGEGDPSRFIELMSVLTGWDYAVSPRQEDYFFDWTDASGTYIALTSLPSDDGDDIYVFYFDAPTISAGGWSVSEPAPAFNPDEP